MSLNNNIIEEFEKLVNYINHQIDLSKQNNNIKEATANSFRLKHIKLSLILIKKYQKELNNETLNEFKEFDGIGKGTIDRIKEILEHGHLKELEGYKNTNNKKLIGEIYSQYITRIFQRMDLV